MFFLDDRRKDTAEFEWIINRVFFGKMTPGTLKKLLEGLKSLLQALSVACSKALAEESKDIWRCAIFPEDRMKRFLLEEAG